MAWADATVICGSPILLISTINEEYVRFRFYSTDGYVPIDLLAEYKSVFLGGDLWSFEDVDYNNGGCSIQGQAEDGGGGTDNH